jgi:excisionase family DNA binding protein
LSGWTLPGERAHSAFLTASDVAERLRCSLRTIHELTRREEIPHRKIGRRCLFRVDELVAWENGAPLETVHLDRGGRVVRPLGAPK